jgi:hypothetical protein
MWIETDAFGLIQNLAGDSARLLGLSARGACARDLRLFFPASFRSVSELMRAANLHMVQATLDLYPRDRKRLRVLVRIEPSSAQAPSGLLRWTIERA